MEPKDFIRMAALGTAARRPASIDDILAAIDDIVGPWWSPVQSEIEEWERRCDLCSASGKDGMRWMCQQTNRLRHDLDLLTRMAGAASPLQGMGNDHV